MAKELVDLDLYLVAKTDKALGVTDDIEKGKTIWLPLSQIEWEMKSVATRTVTVTLPEWLAVKEDLA